MIDSHFVGSDIDTMNYVVPANPILGERVCGRFRIQAQVSCSRYTVPVGAYVAPYVNRQTIRATPPEARLAQRLFDYDDAVSEFIPIKAKRFISK